MAAVLGSLVLLLVFLFQHEAPSVCFLAALLVAWSVWVLHETRALEARRRQRVARALAWLEAGDLSLEQLLEIRNLLGG
jgi:hypothetical protein